MRIDIFEAIVKLTKSPCSSHEACTLFEHAGVKTGIIT